MPRAHGCLWPNEYRYDTGRNRQPAGGRPGLPGGDPGLPGGLPGDAPGLPGGLPGDELYPGAMPGMGSAAGRRTGLPPGLTVLGEGTSDELLEEASEQGIDVLVLFDADVEQNRKTNLVINKTRIEVWDVRRREQIIRTSALNNVRVQIERAEAEYGDDEDPVDTLLEELFAQLESASSEDSDKSLKVREFPEGVRPEHVQGRITQILADEGVETLPMLAEIKFYHSRDLIDDSTLTKCFQQVLGKEDGAKLAQGEEDERVEIVKGLITKES